MAEEGHPCRVSSTGNPCDSLIEQLLNAIACCLSMCTSLCQPREQGPDGTDSTHQPTVLLQYLCILITLSVLISSLIRTRSAMKFFKYEMTILICKLSRFFNK